MIGVATVRITHSPVEGDGRTVTTTTFTNVPRADAERVRDQVAADENRLVNDGVDLILTADIHSIEITD